MSFVNNENLFTVVWMIENHRMSLKKKGEGINSPFFRIKKFSNTKWFLQFYPNGNIHAIEGNVSIYLHSTFDGPQEIKLCFDIFIYEDILTLPKFEKSLTHTFKKGGTGYGCSKLKSDFGNKQKIYIVCYMEMSDTDIKRYTLNDSKIMNALIPEDLKPDSMPPECSTEIFSNVNEDIRDIQKKIFHFPNNCFARSIIPVERKSFSWPLVDILSKVGEISSVLVMTISDIPDLFVSVCSNKNKSIQVTIRATNESFDSFFAVCKISVCDSWGKIRHSIESERYFESQDLTSWHFKLENQNNEVQALESSLCYFCCEITISNGEVVSWIKDDSNFDIWRKQDITTNISSENEIKGKMSELYTSKLLSDVTLQLSDKTFEAHKAMLSVHSPVFKTMFQSDTKENETDIINIKGMESDTLNRMLAYMYSGSLEPMQFEEALKLYKAADRYKIMSLKEKCVSFFLLNFKLDNVCTVLCLAYEYRDDDLKAFVSQFILQHMNEILSSEEWKTFAIENAFYTIDIYEEICIKKLHIQVN